MIDRRNTVPRGNLIPYETLEYTEFRKNKNFFFIWEGIIVITDVDWANIENNIAYI